MKKPEAIDPSKVIIIPRPPIAGTEESSAKKETESIAKNEAESTASKEAESAPKVESPASSKAQTSINPQSE